MLNPRISARFLGLQRPGHLGLAYGLGLQAAPTIGKGRVDSVPQRVPHMELRWSFLRPSGPSTFGQLLVAGSTHPRWNMVWEVFFPYAPSRVERINECAGLLNHGIL